MARSLLIFVFIILSIFFLNISNSEREGTYRLPNNTKPVSYDLFISTDIDSGVFDFYGTVKINITVLEKSSRITLHQYELEIKLVNLTNEQGKEIPIHLPKYDRPRDFIIVETINHIFMPGESIILRIKYKGYLRKDNKGFYRSSYNAKEPAVMSIYNFKLRDERR